jgi:two-component system cell cycle sensor histidine kinase/response regulator CckA
VAESAITDPQVEQLRDRLKMISEVTRGFAEATTDWERLLASVASGLARVVGQSCTVMLLSPDGQELRAAAVHASDAKIQATLRAAFETRPMSLAERPRVRQLIEQGDSYFEPGSEPASPDRVHWQRALGLHSALAVPLRVVGRPLGAIFMGRFSPEVPAYDEADRDLARNLADHAALAIENARLYRAAQSAVTAADESERRLQRTLEVMQEGYSILSRDLCYLYVNQAGAQHTHLTREQLLGHSPLELYPGFAGSKIHLALQQALQGETVRVEEQFVHADGATGYFDLTIQPVPEGLVVLSRDVTDRRRVELRRDSLEEQLRQSQKMDAVGRLAGGVAHDFNNLLSVVLGYGEDMLKELPPENPLREDVEEICKASMRAAELTKQLLLFSRQQMVEPQVLDLSTVVLDLKRMLERLLGERSQLVLSLDSELGRVRVDRGSLEQVCMNLAVNARDAMPEGGKLTIETAQVTLDEAFVREHLGTAPGPYVVLAVSDTGIGMDRETRARIFEPFFTTKPPGQGTGLGLSTVFGIVQHSGGGIWVYSEVGKGTTFKIYLPRVDAEVGLERPAVVTTDVQGDETVLLVEDEPQVRGVARRILERQGYLVLVPQSAEEALRLAEDYAGTIHLLVTDVVMPRMNGSELSRLLRQQRPGLRVLFVSGYTDGSIGALGMLEDGAAFLQKPFTSESLARKVRSVLDKPAG